MKNFLKKTFIAGLITLLPIAGTLWLLKVIIVTAEGWFQSLIPSQFRPDQLIGYHIPGLGILSAVIVVLLIGIFTRLYIGKRLFGYGDRLFHRIPLGRGIYSAIKQFIGAVAGSNHKSFRRVVLVEFPSTGKYMLGFYTGETQGEIPQKLAQEIVSVFIPTTPNPTSGYLLLYPKSKIIPLDMGIEDAFKFIVSGGVVEKAKTYEI